MIEKNTFIPFLMAGYPTLAASEHLASAVLSSGVRVLELGVPFSDPVADGPTIQRASAVALQQNVTLTTVLSMVERLVARHPSAKIILFTYLNPILKMDLGKYVSAAAKAGVAATLTVDLPPEEAGPYLSLHQAAKLQTVFLAAPTTSAQRLRLVDRSASAFVYYVSRLGVTGAQQGLSETLGSELKDLRKTVQKPVAVGFGLSTPAQVLEVLQLSEGAVVGSHFLNVLAQARDLVHAETTICDFVRSVLTATGQGPSFFL